MENLNDISPEFAYLLAALLGWAIWADVRHDLCRLVSGRNVVLCAMAAWYLLEAIMLPEGLRQYTQAQYNQGLLYVGLALAGFLVGYHHTSGCSFFSGLGEKITFFDDESWLWRLVWVGALVGFAPIVYFTGSQVVELFEDMMGMYVTWGGIIGRGRYGDFRSAVLMLEVFIGGVSSFAAILLFRRWTTPVQRLVCGLVVFWPILRAFGSGTRSPLLTSVGSVLAVFYWKATPATRKKMICAVLVCAPLIYGLMAALVISRTSGAFAWENREKAQYVGNEMFRELLFITTKVSSGEVDFQYGYSYYVQLVNPIPRFLWPDKPTLDTGILMAYAYGAVNSQGEAWMTISPGLIGEMYLNLGLVGIFGISAFGGWLVKGWDQIPRLFAHSLPAMVYYSGGLAVLFIMGRSFTMGMFYGLLSLALLAWWIRYCNPHAVTDAASAPVVVDRAV
jgi:hypothetical protein